MRLSFRPSALLTIALLTGGFPDLWPSAVAAQAAAPAPVVRPPVTLQPGNVRVIVLIPEVILRRPVPDPAAETEVQRVLIGGGYRVVDLRQAERNTLRDVLRGARLDGQAVRDLATRFQADVLITGEAFAEEYGAVLGQRGYTARLELKAVDLATGQVFYSDAFTGQGTAPTDAVAGKAALQNVARVAAPAVPRALSGWLGSGTGEGAAVAGRALSVRVTNVPSLRALNGTLTSLRGSGGVKGAVNRQYDRAGALLEVEYSGSPEELAALLEDLGLVVTGISAGEITVSYR